MDGLRGVLRPPGLHKMSKYGQYLQSDHWKRTRDEARRRGKWRCKVCGRRDKLHVHHKTYKNLHREKPHELVLLCEDHHRGVHEFIKNWRAKGYRRLHDYTLTMKYVYRERKKEKRP